MKYFVSAVAWWFVLLAGGNATDVKKDPRASARAQYAKHSADALQIVEPVKISRVFYWKDGGTVGIELIVRGQVTIHVRGHQVLRAEPRFR